MPTNKVKKIIDIFRKHKSPTHSWDYAFYNNNALQLIETPHKLILNPSTDILFSLYIDETFCNILGTMHGGAIATLIDTTTTLSISGLDRTHRHNVSVELSTYYQNPVKKHSTIFILNRINKIGKTLAYSTGDIYDEHNKLLSNSVHVKAMLEKTWL